MSALSLALELSAPESFCMIAERSFCRKSNYSLKEVPFAGCGARNRREWTPWYSCCSRAWVREG